MSTRFADAIDFIMNSATNEQMENLLAAVKQRRAILARRAKLSIRAGSAVMFTHRGVVYSGKVMAVKTKRASVACTSPFATTYNVPLNMLEAA